MSEPLHVFACERCGLRVFPRPLLCPRCAARRWRAQITERGVVEFVTTRQRDDKEIILAEVRTSAGPTIIARCEQDVARRDTVCLIRYKGAILARPGTQH